MSVSDYTPHKAVNLLPVDSQGAVRAQGVASGPEPRSTGQTSPLTATTETEDARQTMHAAIGYAGFEHFIARRTSVEEYREQVDAAIDAYLSVCGCAT